MKNPELPETPELSPSMEGPAIINFETIEATDIPLDVMNFFENRSKQLILPEDYEPGNFEGFQAVRHENGDITYIARQTKTYSTNRETEQLNYLIDFNNQNEETGYAELRLNETNSSYFKNKPFVGFSNTETKYRKQGLGTRRLLTMNALAQSQYHNPLNSDTLLSKGAENLWKGLVKKGLARTYQEGNHTRYVFLDSEKPTVPDET